MDDTEIIDLFFKRDEAAIRYASEKYGDRLRLLSHSIVKNRQTAEECENDTYMEAWNTMPPQSQGAICMRSSPELSGIFP